MGWSFQSGDDLRSDILLPVKHKIPVVVTCHANNSVFMEYLRREKYASEPLSQKELVLDSK